jgi:sulfite reductase (NADPH) flavoprotein alpha-component
MTLPPDTPRFELLRTTDIAWDRDHPWPATLLSQRRLTGAGSTKDVRHIEIDLGASGLRYQPGDTLGIWIRNDETLVAAILGLCQLDPAQSVVIEGQAMTLQTALLGSFELTQAHPGFVKHYTQYCSAPELAQLAADPQALRHYLDRRQIQDVLRQFPASLTASQLLRCLRKLSPRQYSIASSPLVQPQQVGLTVNMVRYQQDDETRTGAASSFLGWHVHTGDRLPVYVVSNPNFRLPVDPAAPVIMIGPGTGIAPFRAFLQQRAAAGAPGANWLFFGNPLRASDFLYEQELQAWLASGVLSRLDLAFSRDQPHKVYVQQRMLEQAAELFAWLERGAHLYVCGDAKRMAEDVQKALLQIITTEGKLDSAAARQYLVNMRQQKRYQRDVY